MSAALRTLRVAGAVSCLAVSAAAQDVGSVLGLTGPHGLHLGTWAIGADRVAPSDLFILPDMAATSVPVPHQNPQVFTQQTPGSGAHAILALVFSDAPVICAEEAGTFPLDTSIAAFMTATDADALYAYGDTLAETGEDPAGLTANTFLGPNHAVFMDLPGSSGFPAAAVQFEGDFPLYAFYDAAGDLTALAGLFGLDIRNGPDLPPCTAPTS